MVDFCLLLWYRKGLRINIVTIKSIIYPIRKKVWNTPWKKLPMMLLIDPYQISKKTEDLRYSKFTFMNRKAMLLAGLHFPHDV